MKRKILLKLVLLFWLLDTLISMSSAHYAVSLDNLWNTLKNKVEWINFAWWGNDFWGMFIVTELKDISSNPVNIDLSSTKRLNCKKQVIWYYWNSLRWWVIYPLDKQTLNYWKWVNTSYYNGLSMVGGFYTGCSWDVASIYGQIKYSSQNIANYIIQAWRKYDVSTNNVSWTNFAENFQIYNDSKILWLIVDSTYWIGFVWWQVNNWWNNLVNTLNDGTINNVVTSITNTSINNTANADITPLNGSIQTIIWILWNFNIMCQKDNNVRQDIKILQKQNKAVLLWENVVNVNTVINKARKNAARLCNWNWQNGDQTINDSEAGKVVCIKDGNVVINADLTLNTTRPTNIIVKWDNKKVIFKKTQSLGSWYVNVFLDNGYVLFDNSNDLLNSVGKNGKLHWPQVTSWFVFKWNIILNGLLAGTDGANITGYKHKLYIKGSLASLNSVWENGYRKDYLENDLLKSLYLENTMKINDVFRWRCLDIWVWTDWVNCSSTEDKYSLNAIIVQKEKYANPLIK